MPKYRVTLQVSGLSGENPSEVKSALDEQLKKSGIENCRIVGIDPDGMSARAAARAPASAPVDSAWRRQANAGGLLLVAAAAWAIWFFWWMLSTAPE